MTATNTPKTKTEAKQPSDKRQKKRLWRCSGLILLAVIALIISIGALMISLKSYHHINQQRLDDQQIQQKLTDYNQQLNNTTVALSQMQRQMTGLLRKHTAKPHIRAQAVQASKPHAHVEPSINVLYVMSAKINVNLALNMLVSRQPVRNIVLLLDQAKRDLAPLGQQATTITTLIAQTSQQISMLPTLSPNRIAQDIQQLSSSLPTLTLSPIVMPSHPAVSARSSVDKDWRAYANQSWHWLKQFLVIRHDDHLSQHLIYQSDRMHFVQLMQVYLQQAIWANWQGHQKPYQRALAMVGYDVRHFTQANAAQNAWLKKLAVLSKKSVAYASVNQQAALIQIGHSLQVLAHTLAIEGSQHA